MKHEPEEKIVKAPRWRRWLLIFGAMMLLLFGAVWYAYDRMTDHLLEVLMEESLPLNETTELAGAASRNSEQEDSVSNKTPRTASQPIGDDSVDAASNPSSTSQGTGAEEDAAASSNQPNGENGTNAGNQSSDENIGSNAGNQPSAENGAHTGKKSGSANKAGISVDEASEAGSKVTMMEKIEIGSVLLQHWSADDLKSFQSTLGGGLTVEEKRELKRKAMEQLSEEEYNRLIAIAKKYGMSQGKSYKQSSEEE
ncbi:hypothetical protein PAECIP111893_02639 [Paenibacillus plantiphilus]|uniref:Host cell surface-exposed lipoprotein n=1 Tax=Paenibacillus plantiphilus TaxID=2905650 RepID=A0ABN8GE99_9BACL|nr:hypothetical protein [Paenibacillus plantiphilus]CAH1206881.1 hypothetical protein PAECIP111893_02639 [Paenibacillus plantiphilus]